MYIPVPIKTLNCSHGFPVEFATGGGRTRRRTRPCVAGDDAPDIGQNAAAGEEAPRNPFVPVRIAELFLERWDIDAVWTTETDGSMWRRSDSAST